MSQLMQVCAARYILKPLLKSAIIVLLGASCN